MKGESLRLCRENARFLVSFLFTLQHVFFFLFLQEVKAGVNMIFGQGQGYRLIDLERFSSTLSEAHVCEEGETFSS